MTSALYDKTIQSQYHQRPMSVLCWEWSTAHFFKLFNQLKKVRWKRKEITDKEIHYSSGCEILSPSTQIALH